MLEPFKVGGRIPDKARTDPSVLIKDQGDHGLSLSRLFEYVPFFVSNGESYTFFRTLSHAHLFREVVSQDTNQLIPLVSSRLVNRDISDESLRSASSIRSTET